MTMMPDSGRMGEPSCRGFSVLLRKAMESGRQNDAPLIRWSVAALSLLSAVVVALSLLLLSRDPGGGSEYPSPPLSKTDTSFRPETR